MNRIVSKIAEIDGGEITVYSGNYDFYERERQIRETNKEAAYARQQAMLAKEQRFIDRFKAQAAKAAQVQSGSRHSTRSRRSNHPKSARSWTSTSDSRRVRASRWSSSKTSTRHTANV